MSAHARNRSLAERLLLTSARVFAHAEPLSRRLLPETLEIDDNHSLWVSQMPDYRPNPPLRAAVEADLAIIGGGFTGVSTAYHFSRRYPEKRVVLLEAKTLANGASGRNGGMLLNWLPDMHGCDAELTRCVYDMTHAGIRMIADLIARHALPVSYRLDGTLTVYTDPQRAEAAQREAELHRQLGIPVEFLDAAALKQRLNLRGVYGAVLDPHSGQINGAQLVRSLRPVLEAQGVAIYEGTPVLRVREGRTVTLETPAATVRAGAVVLATNAYTGKLGYFRDALFPLHSHVIATAPLGQDDLARLGWHALAGYSDDMDRIAYSSLTREGNIVFGGGSNPAYAYLFRNRTIYPGSPDSARARFARIARSLYAYLPELADRPIAHRWTGTLGITLNRQPLIGVRGEARNVFYAIGYSGHGVTLANLAGQILTDLYSGADERWRGFPFYQPHYVPIPPEPFRWVGYQLFSRLTGRSPRV
jgi:glycine/D-amino acid oxidase-like deaminating enzyme